MKQIVTNLFVTKIFIWAKKIRQQQQMRIYCCCPEKIKKSHSIFSNIEQGKTLTKGSDIPNPLSYLKVKVLKSAFDRCKQI